MARPKKKVAAERVTTIRERVLSNGEITQQIVSKETINPIEAEKLRRKIELERYESAQQQQQMLMMGYGNPYGPMPPMCNPFYDNNLSPMENLVVDAGVALFKGITGW